MPVTHFKTAEKYRYLNGFGSYHEYVLGDDNLHIVVFGG